MTHAIRRFFGRDPRVSEPDRTCQQCAKIELADARLSHQEARLEEQERIANDRRRRGPLRVVGGRRATDP